MFERAYEMSQFVFAFYRDGWPTGQTPNQVVHRQNKSCVRYFAPAEAKHAPLFISMPLINTWTVFDLAPGKSVIEKLLEAGIPVYLMDWGIPDAEDADVGMEELLESVLHRAIDRVRRHAAATHGADQLDALGYCVGGTFLAAYLGLYPNAFRRVAFLAAPLDFDHAGRLGTWADPETFPLDALVDNLGNFPPELMRSSFAWLQPGTQNAKWRSLYNRFEQPGFKETWAAVEAWNSHNIPFWGEAYRSYIRNCYFENCFTKDGWPIGGRRADLRNVEIPALVIAANTDHICPTAAAFGVKDVWGGPVKTVELRGGHVGVCLGRSLPNTIIAWAEEAIEA